MRSARAPKASSSSPVRAVATPRPSKQTSDAAEPYTKATVVLRNSQIVFLDRLASNIRAKTGTAIARAEIIRALIDMLSERDVDVSGACSESDIKKILLKHMKPS